MAHRRKLPDAKQMQEPNLKKPKLSRTERKQLQRQKEKKKWIKKMKSRGGFIQKRAKRWGDPCSHTECKMWENGECQYSERDINGCYLEKGEQYRC